MLYKPKQLLLMLLWLIFCLSLTLSPALISLSLAGIALLGIFDIKSTKLTKKEAILSVLFIAFFFINALTYFNSENSNEAIRKIILKIPIALIPLYIISFKNNKKLFSEFAIILLYSAYLPAIISVYNYVINKTLFDQLILESKPLPIEFGYGIYHIQFSIILACSIVIGLYLLVNNFKTKPRSTNFYVIGILTVLNFLALHILSARTGLLACYVGIGLLGIVWLKKASKKTFIISSISIIVIPILLLLVSRSLQNRLKNTYSDLKVVIQKADPNDYSFAMRVEAWKNAIAVIKDNPIAGVGIGDAEEELYNHFEITNPKINKENRKNPHFQLLESGVQSGIFVMLLFLIAISFGLLHNIQHQPLLSSIILLLFISSCFESILERQTSVAAFAILISLSNAKNSEGKTADNLIE